MSRVGKTIYQISRKMAGFRRRVDAAEELGLSERTLARYESGETRPDDATVANMVKLYKDKLLALKHLMTSPIGKIILAIKNKAKSAATLKAKGKGDLHDYCTTNDKSNRRKFFSIIRVHSCRKAAGH